MTSNLSIAMPSESKTYWARVDIYNPFVMGGHVWQWYKYKITADVIEHTIAGYDAFAFFDDHSGKWTVYETSTGGWLASHVELERALFRAKYDIDRTPDFQKQMHEMRSLDSLPEYDTEEALRRLAKTRENHIDPDEEDINNMKPNRVLEL